MKILADVGGNVTFVSRLPVTKILREENRTSISVSTRLKLCEEFCGDGGLGGYFSVWVASINQDEVSVRCIALLLGYVITSPILWLVAVLSTAVENHHDVSALDFTEATRHVLERVVRFRCVVEYNLCDVVLHAAVTGVVDDK